MLYASVWMISADTPGASLESESSEDVTSGVRHAWLRCELQDMAIARSEPGTKVTGGIRFLDELHRKERMFLQASVAVIVKLSSSS